MGKRELVALLNLSSWCLVVVERLFLTVPRGCLQFVIVVFPDHTHLLFFMVFLLTLPNTAFMVSECVQGIKHIFSGLDAHLPRNHILSSILTVYCTMEYFPVAKFSCFCLKNMRINIHCF